MNEIQQFPNTFQEFIHVYKFNDKFGEYTNNADLIPVFRVMQGWDHYTIKAEKELNELKDMICDLYTLTNKFYLNSPHSANIEDLNKFNAIYLKCVEKQLDVN